MELVSTILALALKIAKAVETAHKNKAMCLDLADRVRTICDILRKDRDSGAIMTAGGGDSQASEITRGALGRLKAALDEALKLVESQRQSGVIERAVASFTADVAGEFQRLHTKISDCVNDLKYAKVVAADHRAQDDNTRTAPQRPSPQFQPSRLRPSELLKQLQPSPQARQITRPALDDALKLVESQRQSGGIERVVAFFTTDAAGEFLLLQAMISHCVHDLNYAKLVASHHRAQDDNTRTAPLKPAPLRPSLRLKLQPSPLRPSELLNLLQPSPLTPSPQVQPSRPRPSELLKQLQPSPLTPSPQLQPSALRPSELLKLLQPSPLTPSPQLHPSPLRPSELLKLLQPSP